MARDDGTIDRAGHALVAPVGFGDRHRSACLLDSSRHDLGAQLILLKIRSGNPAGTRQRFVASDIGIGLALLCLCSMQRRARLLHGTLGLLRIDRHQNLAGPYRLAFMQPGGPYCACRAGS